MEDNKWYAVDVTWNDSLSNQNKKVCTDYLLVGSKTKIGRNYFEVNHIESTVKLGIEYSGRPELSIDAYQKETE